MTGGKRRKKSRKRKQRGGCGCGMTGGKRRKKSRKRKQRGGGVSWLGGVWSPIEEVGSPQGQDIQSLAGWAPVFNEWVVTNLDADELKAWNTTFIYNKTFEVEKQDTTIWHSKPTFYYKVGNQWKKIGLTAKISL